jgi:exo-beta-1,3-glucanase (GH17 family)
MPDEAADKKPEIKPGYKTTEFWISLAAVIIGSVVASGIVPADSVWERIIGLVVSALAALGYTGARLSIKKAY